jgi:hypothetical protein
MIYIRLECSKCICKTEWHNLVLKLAVTSSKSRLVYVAFLDSDGVIGTAEVQYHECLGLTYQVMHLWD